jgi:type I restriction enzyme R subunit
MLSKFQDIETDTPTILTTSKLLSTGVDAPTVKNVVLARTVGSMCEFKQIIGRGTRLRTDYGKCFFNIIDFTGSATEKFADPTFDGFPTIEQEIVVDDEGNVVNAIDVSNDSDAIDKEPEEDLTIPTPGQNEISFDDEDDKIKKYYVDNVEVKIVAEVVYELDSQGNGLLGLE